MKTQKLIISLVFILFTLKGYTFTLIEELANPTCTQPVVFISDTLHADSNDVNIEISINSVDFINTYTPYNITVGLTNTDYFQYLGAVQYVSGDASSIRYAYQLKSPYTPISGTLTQTELVVKYGFGGEFVSDFSSISKTCLNCPVCLNRYSMLYEYTELPENIFNTVWPYSDYYGYAFSQLGSYEQAAVTQTLNWMLGSSTSLLDYAIMLDPTQVGNSSVPSDFCSGATGFDCTAQKALWLKAHFLNTSLSGITDTSLTAYDSLQAAVFESSDVNCIAGANYIVYFLTNSNNNGYDIYFVPGQAGYPTVLGAVIFSGGSTYTAIAYSYNATSPYGIVFDTIADTFAYQYGFLPVPPDSDIANGALPFSNLVIAYTPPLSFCNGGSVALSASAMETGSWLWSNAATDSAITVSATGNYSVTLTDGESCTATGNTITVTVWGNPAAHAGSNDTICTLNSVVIGGSPAATSGTPPYTYAWAPTTGLNTAAIGRPTASPTATTSYVLTVTDSNTCTGKDTMQVVVNCLPPDFVSRFESAPYIFEGQVISSNSYWTSDSSSIYTSNIIQISQILKGNLTCGTVELITQGGAIDSITEGVTNALHLRGGNTGIFLCNLTYWPLPASTYYPLDNSQVLGPVFEEQSFIKYWWNGEEIQASDMTYSYGSYSNVYTLAEAAIDSAWISCGSELHLKKKSANYQHNSRAPKGIDKNIARINPNNINRNDSTKKQLLRGADIYYSMDGPIYIDGTYHQYIQLSIYAYTDFDTKIPIGDIELQYGTPIFGSYMSSRVAVAQGGSIPFPDYDATTGNDSANILNIFYENDDYVDTSTYTTFYAYSKTLLFTLTFPVIGGCDFIDIISFYHLPIIDSNTLYFQSFDSTYHRFDNIFEESGVEVAPSCDAHISGFKPKILAGGVNDTLTITGYNFGTTQGNGNVYFKNANDGGLSEVYLDASDVIWSDTLIKVIVPSYNQDKDSLGYIIPTLNGAVVGSGTFRVVSNTGSKVTADSLTVLYSVTNQIIAGTKWANWLEGPNNHGYKFYVDTNIWRHNAQALACIKKALREWTCLTGVNWKVDSFYVSANDTLPTIEDRHNFIHFGNAGTSSLGNVLAHTYPYTIGCHNQLFYDEIDIAISNKSFVVWSYDTTGADLTGTGKTPLYDVLIHELGHAQSLNHVDNSLAIMYYKNSPTNASAAQRKINLSGDSSCDYGGNWVIYSSTHLSPLLNCNGLIPMIRDSICVPFQNGIENIREDNELLIYPNPSDNSITIQFKINAEYKVEFSLVNLYGQVLFSVFPTQIHTGINSVMLNLENYPAGVYLLQSKVNNNFFINKIVHLNSF